MACSAKPVEYGQGDSGDTVDRHSPTRTVDPPARRERRRHHRRRLVRRVADRDRQDQRRWCREFSPANTSGKLSTYADKGLYFRDAPPDNLQGAVDRRLVAEDGNASAYILALNDAYGTGLADVIVAACSTAAGVEVVGKKIYDPKAASFDAEVAEIRLPTRTRSS